QREVVFVLETPDRAAIAKRTAARRVGADLVCVVVDGLIEGNDFSGPNPASRAFSLGLKPEPRSIDLLDEINAVWVPLSSSGRTLELLLVRDLIAGPEH